MQMSIDAICVNTMFDRGRMNTETNLPCKASLQPVSWYDKVYQLYTQWLLQGDQNNPTEDKRLMSILYDVLLIGGCVVFSSATVSDYILN